MFTRRMFVALAVCLAVSASSAFAGGDGGTKKNSHLKVINNTGASIYAFTNVNAQDIEDASFEDDPLQAFEDLGGKLIEPGGEVNFDVRGGTQRLTVVDVDNEVPVFVDRSVTVRRGQTTTISVDEDDYVDL